MSSSLTGTELVSGTSLTGSVVTWVLQVFTSDVCCVGMKTATRRANTTVHAPNRKGGPGITDFCNVVTHDSSFKNDCILHCSTNDIIPWISESFTSVMINVWCSLTAVLTSSVSGGLWFDLTGLISFSSTLKKKNMNPNIAGPSPLHRPRIPVIIPWTAPAKSQTSWMNEHLISCKLLLWFDSHLAGRGPCSVTPARSPQENWCWTGRR